MLPDQLDRLSARDLRKMELFAIQAIAAMNPDATPTKPMTPAEMLAKRDEINNREAVTKARGYALSDEIGKGGSRG